LSEEPYGVRVLPELYRAWSATGMVANIGTGIVELAVGRLVLEGNLTAEAHGFPTSNGTIVHGGAIATLADEALASVAFTSAEEGETTVTADLKVDSCGPPVPEGCSPGPRCVTGRAGWPSARRSSSRTAERSWPRLAR
jgi:hypothetical protein